MATQITVDPITDKEREVASILEELPNLIMSLERAETTDAREPTSPALQNKKKAGPTSPVTTLCPPNSSSEEQLVAPPAKPVKKRKSKKERLMEKKEEVALLSKEKEDLTRELVELQEKCRRLKAVNFCLKDKSEGIKKSTNRSSLNFKIKLAPPPKPPVEFIQPAIVKPKGEFNLDAVVASMTCQFYRVEKAARSAQARKRRLEIMQGKRTSSARKPPLIQRAVEKPKGEFNQDAVVALLTCQLYKDEKAAKSAQARKRRLEIMQGKRTSPARKRPRV